MPACSILHIYYRPPPCESSLPTVRNFTVSFNWGVLAGIHSHTCGNVFYGGVRNENV